MQGKFLIWRNVIFKIYYCNILSHVTVHIDFGFLRYANVIYKYPSTL